METKEFEYNGKTVGFEINDKNVMVNATQMAKVFGKNIAHFMENESTKQFVNACLNSRNSDYLKVFHSLIYTVLIRRAVPSCIGYWRSSLLPGSILI